MNNNPNNIKVGDTIYVEEAWEDEGGYYHDEYAKVTGIDDNGYLSLKFNRPDITRFLSSADFEAKNYIPETDESNHDN